MEKQSATSKNLDAGLAALPWVLGAAGFGYLAYRVYQSTRVAPHGKIEASVRSRLPVSKGLNTISDAHGNYDIDGVSFDDDGVVVSGDGHKGVTASM